MGKIEPEQYIQRKKLITGLLIILMLSLFSLRRFNLSERSELIFEAFLFIMAFFLIRLKYKNDKKFGVQPEIPIVFMYVVLIAALVIIAYEFLAVEHH